MSGTLLMEQLLLPENTKRIGEVFTSIATVLGKQAVTVVDDDMPFITVTVRDNTPIVTMSRTFIAGIGTHKLVVTGKFSEDRIYDEEEPAPIETTIDLPAKAVAPTDIQQLIDDGYIVFTKKETAGYTVTCKPNILDTLDGPIVNLVKRGTVDEQIYKHLCSSLGQKHYLIGDPWPEPVVYTVTDGEGSHNEGNQTSDCPGGICQMPARLQANNNPSVSTGPHHQQIQVVTKYVITEKLVHVDKLVIKEVPVEVERIVKVPYEVIKEVYICKHTAGPISTNVDDTSKPTTKPVKCAVVDDPDEDVDDKKPVKSTSKPVAKPQPKKREPTPSASSDEQESSQDESQHSDKTDNISSSKSTPPKKVQIKGTWLDDNKTVLKSGEYVFRVSRGGESGSKFEAIGRFNPSSKTKRDPLQPQDVKKIKALGKQYSIARNCMPE